MSTGDRIWGGYYWGRNGALRTQLRENRAKFLSAQSSAHHSAAGNARSRGEQATGIKKFLWLLRGVFHLELAVWYSNRAWKTVSKPTPGQCDIRQSVLRAAARLLWHPFALDEAERVINRGLEGFFDGPRPTPNMTELLLFVGDADVALRTGGAAVQYRVNRVFRLAEARLSWTDTLSTGAQDVQEVRQLVRIYRHLSDFYTRLGDASKAEVCKGTAIELARSSGAHDQLIKMGVEV